MSKSLKKVLLLGSAIVGLTILGVHIPITTHAKTVNKPHVVRINKAYSPRVNHIYNKYLEGGYAIWNKPYYQKHAKRVTTIKQSRRLAAEHIPFKESGSFVHTWKPKYNHKTHRMEHFYTKFAYIVSHRKHLQGWIDVNGIYAHTKFPVRKQTRHGNLYWTHLINGNTNNVLYKAYRSYHTARPLTKNEERSLNNARKDANHLKGKSRKEALHKIDLAVKYAENGRL